MRYETTKRLKKQQRRAVQLMRTSHALSMAVAWQNDAMPAHDPARIPTLLYGTAWKEERTASLTELALRVGFRGGLPRHRHRQPAQALLRGRRRSRSCRRLPRGRGHTRRPVPADEVHLSGRSGRPATL